MRVGALVLAAGQSVRFGSSNKLLAQARGEPLIRRAARAVMESNADVVWAVTGADHAALSAAVAEFPICCLTLSKSEGLGASIAFAVNEIDQTHGDLDGLLIVPGDMPELGSEFINQIIATFLENRAQHIVVAANAQGEQRNPVLWPRRRFRELAAMKGGESGAKVLIAADPYPPMKRCPSDDRCLDDIDTPEQLAAFNGGVDA
jgi:molybdenum cofactor cytidylyltransferase